MSESEKATLDTGRLPVCDQQKILQQVRDRCLGGQLTGPAGDQSSLKVNVDGQPLLAYRPQEYPGKPSSGFPLTLLLGLCIFRI